MQIISGHQPVYLPWLGLFHKISLCDRFVYMDTVQYLSNDWNNRNYVRNKEDKIILTVPIDKKKTKSNKLNDIKIFNNYQSGDKNWQQKHFEIIKNCYSNSEYFKNIYNFLDDMYLKKKWDNLIDLCFYQYQFFCEYIGLNKHQTIRMSKFKFEGEKSDLILDHCLKLNGSHVILGENGKNYLNLKIFSEKNINVYFQKYNHPSYKQKKYKIFFSNLSILDLLCNIKRSECLKKICEGNVNKEEILNKDY